MSFSVGLSPDLQGKNTQFSWGEISIETLSPLAWKFTQNPGANFTPEMVAGFDAIAFGAPGVIKGSFASAEDSPICISRFGVGYDNIDLEECTRAGVALTITVDGSQKPVATAALTLLLSTMHRLGAKQQQNRDLAWDKRIDGLGSGLNGKTIATIGLGSIATEFFRLLSPFDCTRIAYDPWKKREEAASHTVELVELTELLQRADAIIVLAVLTPDTHHLLSTAQFKQMKKSAFVINISRGSIIDEQALISALTNGDIAGAGLDVFEKEPLTASSPLTELSNVISTPHNLAWTDELAFGMGRSAFTSIKSFSQGLIPQFVVNKDVLQTPQFLNKLEKWKK